VVRLMDADIEQDFGRELRDYSAAVATAVGSGLEACAFDLDIPASVYVAIDWRLDRFPDRDLALLWDERHGWAVVLEAPGRDDLAVLAYLGAPEIIPDPRDVVKCLAALRAGDHIFGRPDPPWFRKAGNHGELLERLARHRVTG
jgi:hypothetical protein